jgi:hypothetical protein
MLFAILGAFAVFMFIIFLRAKGMGPLFANEHLLEVAAGLPELKRKALAGQKGESAALQTRLVAIAYTISRDEGVWVHHLSVSNQITRARAAGTFFLGLLRSLLHLEAYPMKAFVSQNSVFHLVVRLSDDEETAFAARVIEPKDAAELHAIAAAGRGVILPQLAQVAVPDAA